jgi:hypothetical protein
MRNPKKDHTRFVFVYYSGDGRRRVRTEVEVASRAEAEACVDAYRAIGFTASFDEMDVRS